MADLPSDHDPHQEEEESKPDDRHLNSEERKYAHLRDEADLRLGGGQGYAEEEEK